MMNATRVPEVSNVDIRMAKVRQLLAKDEINVRQVLRRELSQQFCLEAISPGERIAISVGSRGIAEMAEIVKILVTWVKGRGASPFIVPAMGSHGQASADGQREILAGYGINEEAIGAPILSSMEVVCLGKTPNGALVYLDRYAFEADGIIVFNRVKPHTLLKGPLESGLCKMMTVGLGKEKGAASMHDHGLRETIPAAVKLILAKAPVKFGVAVVENSFDRPARLEVIRPAQIEEREKELLVLAKSLLPRIPFDSVDLLLVDWIGKNLSGTGLDSNVIGLWRRTGEKVEGDIDIKRIGVLDLTSESHGNALGIGFADYTTRRLYEKIDFKATYKNAVISHFVSGAKIPMIFDTEKELWETALRELANNRAKVVRIPSTLHLESMLVSDSLLSEVNNNPNLELEQEPREVLFTSNGNFIERFLTDTDQYFENVKA